MTWGFSSFETRFRWAAALWAILMTVWCMSPLPWQARAIGGLVWVAITIGVSLRFSWWRPRLPREVPICLVAGVDVALLEPLVRNLLAAGYRFQTVGEALESPVRKAVVLTFDGGTRDHFTILLPFLRRMGVKATCVTPSTSSLWRCRKWSAPASSSSAAGWMSRRTIPRLCARRSCADAAG